MMHNPALLVGFITALLSFLTLLVLLFQRDVVVRDRLHLLDRQGQAAAETMRSAMIEAERAIGGRIEALRLETGAALSATKLQQAELLGTHTSRLSEAGMDTRLMLEVKLREMGEAQTAKLAEIQGVVHEQLHKAVERQMEHSFQRVIDQFAAVQKAMGDVQAVTAQIGDLKRIFGNVKTRGGWGETQLRVLLDDILPAGSYDMNRKLRQDSDDMVEVALHMPVRGDQRPCLAIDAKFPVEDYERLLDASEQGDADAERQARKALETRLRLEARKIGSKYINPPITVEFAVLYLPTDGLYAEIARVPGLIEELSRTCKVMILGPSLLPALLRTIQLGFVTLALEQKADEVRLLLGATRTEMLKMDDVLDRLAKQATTFHTTIDKARIRTRAVGRKLRGMEAIDPARAAILLETEDDFGPDSTSLAAEDAA